MAGELEEFIYEESKRAIEGQHDAVQNLHTRTGTLLSIAALVTAFFGGQNVNDVELTDPVKVAVLAFLFVLGLSIYILWPRSWTFVFSAKILLEDHAAPPQTPLPKLHAFLAKKLEQYLDHNRIEFNRMLWAFEVACLALAVEVLAWLVEVV